MKTMMIFDKLVTLNRDRHRDLRLDLSQLDFQFAQHTNSVPLAMEEVPEAALSYPCVFIERDGKHALCALLGLDAGRNLMVQTDGQWAEGSYVPAHLRRYPFALAETGEADHFLVCIDEACAGLNLSEGQALFDQAGQEADVLKESKAFLMGLHRAFAQSATWCDEVARLGLLEDRVAHFTRADGSAGQLAGFKVIQEDRLKTLPAEVLQRWNQEGLMAVAWGHLISLGHVKRLALLQAHADAASPRSHDEGSATLTAAPTPVAETIAETISEVQA